MVDLETMDNVASAAIVSIGAVECDLTTGEIGSGFYRVVDLKDQVNKHNMTIDSKTLYWWLANSEGARAALCVDGKISLEYMCRNFKSWVESLKTPAENIRLWGNGASFDNAIISYAFRQFDMKTPTKFWNDRDMRTIVGFYPSQMQEKWRRTTIKQGDFHNAMDDAKNQVRYCSHILKELGVKELY